MTLPDFAQSVQFNGLREQMGIDPHPVNLERLISAPSVRAYEAHSDRGTGEIRLTLYYEYTSQTVNLYNLNYEIAF